MARKKTRTKLVCLALTPEEKREFQGFAKSLGMDFSNFVRQLVYREIKQSKLERGAA